MALYPECAERGVVGRRKATTPGHYKEGETHEAASHVLNHTIQHTQIY
jgi:hypothetical protein